MGKSENSKEGKVEGRLGNVGYGLAKLGEVGCVCKGWDMMGDI